MYLDFPPPVHIRLHFVFGNGVGLLEVDDMVGGWGSGLSGGEVREGVMNVYADNRVLYSGCATG